MDKKIPTIVVVGPTASGKTKLSVDLAKAFGGEVISADSMQIYKYMDIATARVTREEMQDIPHHLVDFLEPSSTYSVAQFAADATKISKEIISRGNIPVIAGGTGLYIWALLDGITFTEHQSSAPLREKLYTIAQKNGAEALHQMLQKVDPQEAKNIHPNNTIRVIRAIEMFHISGKPKSHHIENSKKIPSIFTPIIIGLSCNDRKTLYSRINQRVDAMMAKGLLEETKNIVDMGYGRTASNAIGYKELLPYLQSEVPLAHCVEELKKSTRHYAKRQLSWFHRDDRIHWLYTDTFDSYSDIVASATTIVKKGLREMEGLHEQ